MVIILGKSVDALVPKKIAVLGGTGFVGQEICRIAIQSGCEVVSLSRRGDSAPGIIQNDLITYKSCDVASPGDLKKALGDVKSYDCFFHTIGLLFDVESGLSQFNKFMSGSGSVPGAESTYDRVTRQTAMNAIEAIESAPALFKKTTKPFVFVSAAEAGWTFEAPVGFLERYLRAKRSVEDRLTNSNVIREIILRPSLIWTPEKPLALLSVIPFFVANAAGLSFVDRPMKVQNLALAAWAAVCAGEQGVLRYPDMDRLAAQDSAALATRSEL